MSEGLRRTNLNLAPRAGYVEVGGGVSTQRGPFAWGEAGFRIHEDVSLFARAQADRSEASAVAGVRWDFGI